MVPQRSHGRREEIFATPGINKLLLKARDHTRVCGVDARHLSIGASDTSLAEHWIQTRLDGLVGREIGVIVRFLLKIGLIKIGDDMNISHVPTWIQRNPRSMLLWYAQRWRPLSSMVP